MRVDVFVVEYDPVAKDQYSVVNYSTGEVFYSTSDYSSAWYDAKRLNKLSVERDGAFMWAEKRGFYKLDSCSIVLTAINVPDSFLSLSGGYDGIWFLEWFLVGHPDVKGVISAKTLDDLTPKSVTPFVVGKDGELVRVVKVRDSFKVRYDYFHYSDLFFLPRSDAWGS
jgi:hypothetical protein